MRDSPVVYQRPMWSWTVKSMMKERSGIWMEGPGRVFSFFLMNKQPLEVCTAKVRYKNPTKLPLNST